MNITEATPRQDITIAGRTLAVAMPFSEGHTLNKNEAAAMNQLFAENIRNNFAARLRRHDEAKKEAEEKGENFTEVEPDQSDLDNYMASYEFGVRSGGFISADPVEREALSIALTAVRNAIKAQGTKLKDVDPEALEQKAREVYENNKEALRARAEQVINARKDIDLQM